ncbi:MAG: hydrogenase maturation nickel metallochaperone HypA [Planctomycetia bacterium]
MHELSIVTKIVEIATHHVREAGGSRVIAVTLRIGRLSCVHEDALRYGFDLVREGTPLAGAELRIVAVPVSVWCPRCEAAFELPGIQRFACPSCGHLSADIRTGRELDLESIEIETMKQAPLDRAEATTT